MRSVPAAQSQLQNVSVRSHAEVIPASTPITVSVVPAVHDSAESLGVAVGSGRRAIVLAVCCSALFMVGLDNTIVNVGLPEIGKSLHTSVAGLQWTVAGYTIVLASLLMFSGAAADRIGRRTIFQVGLSLFTLGSWLCSLAPVIVLADRVPRAAGGRREHAQPGGARHHHECLQRAEGPGQGDRGLGRRVRSLHGPRAGGRRHPRRLRRLARHLLGEHPRRPGRDLAHRAARARLEGREGPQGRPPRPGPGDRHARLAGLRDHPGAVRRLVLAATSPGSSCSRSPRSGCCCATSRAAPSR